MIVCHPPPPRPAPPTTASGTGRRLETEQHYHSIFLINIVVFPMIFVRCKHIIIPRLVPVRVCVTEALHVSDCHFDTTTAHLLRKRRHLDLRDAPTRSTSRPVPWRLGLGVGLVRPNLRDGRAAIQDQDKQVYLLLDTHFIFKGFCALSLTLPRSYIGLGLDVATFSVTFAEDI